MPKMINDSLKLVLVPLLLDPNPLAPAKWHPGHYVFVAHQAIRPEHILDHFRGVQRCYTWKALEPEQGRYDFSAIIVRCRPTKAA
jgi:hypothetical protein